MKSITATPICKCCFKPIRPTSLSLSASSHRAICDRCYAEFNPRISYFRILGTRCMCLFPYDEAIRSHLFQFKGCFDYELGEIFLSRASVYLKCYLRGYSLIPAPSFWLKDEKRGFNHVETMFSVLGLPQIKAIRKTEDIKQSDLSSKDRQSVRERLEWVEGVSIKGKNVALVDDVLTTGATIKACLKMIKDHYPKSIKVVVMSRTIWKG